MRRYPLSNRFLLHADHGRRGRRVRQLAGTSDWRRAILDRLGGVTVAVAGTGLLRPGAWTWPEAPPDEVVDWLRTDCAELADLSIVAAACPRQHGRARLSLLCRRGPIDVVVKLGLPADGIENEATVLRLLSDAPLPAIATPRVLAAGTIGDGSNGGPIAYLATDALGLDGQRPAIGEPLATFESDLAARLHSMPRPPGTPSGAVPVHGDLAPWNLRRTSRGLALFDWEAAGWGQPGSDLDYYRACCEDLRVR
jgi:hypothetical protein